MGFLTRVLTGKCTFRLDALTKKTHRKTTKNNEEEDKQRDSIGTNDVVADSSSSLSSDNVDMDLVERRMNICKEWIQRFNSHDLEAARTLLTEDFRFEFDDHGKTLKRRLPRPLRPFPTLSCYAQ